ncbi:MAG: class I SAM-dependent methyltransferase [Chloroflexi bacterium]|nr:class I SAM-dependent methyltransferase [Chloroflexota bacterium]
MSGQDRPPICDYEGSSYRTDFWAGQGREYEDGAERVALRRLLPPTGRRLIEIGAGFGRLADLYGGYEQVILLDYSRSQLEYARAQYGDDRFLYIAADLYRLPLATNAVDTAVMVRVLHHLADVPLALGQIARVLRPQGTFVLEFANKRHLKNILRYILSGGRGLNPFAHEPYEFAELHYDFHPDWVAERLRKADLAPERRLSVSLLRSALLKRIFTPSLLVLLDAALQRLAAPLTPGASVFVRSIALKPGEPMLVEATRLFRCPTCGHEPLLPEERGLVCVSCGARWPIEEGIYLFKQ